MQFLLQDPTALVSGGFLNTTNGTQSVDSGVARYIGNRMVSVLVQDGPTGDIFGIDVLNPNFNPQ